MRLTDVSIKHLSAPQKGSKIYVCDQLDGFGVRVSQAGTKAFVLTYGKDRERVTIGRYPIIGLAEARTEAKRILAERTLGKHRPARLRGSEALTRFLTEQRQKNRAITVRDTERILRNHFPKILAKNLEDVRTDDVTDVTDKLLKRGLPGAANHAFTAIRTFLRWCVKRRYLTHSPIEGIDLPAKGRVRKRVLSDDELRAVWLAADELGGHFGDIVKLLILTGQRRTEISNLRESWCTLTGPPFSNSLPTICLPGDLTKNHLDHTFPISALCMAVIRSNITDATTLLFPARGKPDRPFCGWSKGKALLDKKMKIAHWTLHDLRRTFSTGVARLGVLPHVKEAILNHASAKTDVERIYDLYQYLPEMKDALDRWEAHLLSILQQDQGVLPLVA